MASTTHRAIQWCRENGLAADIAERRITRTLTKDLFGFIDLIALGRGETIAIQVTSKSNVSARMRKIEESEHLPAVLAAGWRVWVMGWGDGPEPRIEEIAG